MIRQYFAHRRRGGCNPLGVGVIPVGAIFYIQDDGWWRDRYRGAPICRDPWIVEAFLNGTLAAAHRNADNGRWEDVTMARRADTASFDRSRRPPPHNRRSYPRLPRGRKPPAGPGDLSGPPQCVPRDHTCSTSARSLNNDAAARRWHNARTL